MVHEGPPSVAFRAKREVESRVSLEAEERAALEAKLHTIPGVVQHAAVLSDTGFAVPGLNGRARIREVHPDDGTQPFFEWSVKVKVPESTTRIVKAPFEYQGEARSYDEAMHDLATFLQKEVSVEPNLTCDRTYVHHRSTYTLPEGVTISVDTFTNVDGTELNPPNESVEIEVLLDATATPEDIKNAEQLIVQTAVRLGIPVERLSSVSNRKGIKVAA